MASLSYATTGSGIIAGGLGWINFGTFTLGPGSSVTGITAALRDGSILKFDISNTAVSGGGATVVASTVPTFGGAPFGISGYTGITGNVALWTNGNTASTTITLDNITVTDPFGNPVSYYTIYVGDGEATTTGESISATTDGGVWSLLTTVGSGPSPTLSGTGTQTVSFTGSGSPFNAPICGTVNPTTVSSTLTEVNQVGRSAIVIGISVNKISLNKVITNRFSSSDQFNLTVTGASSASTTTFGSTIGAQPVSAYVFPVTLGNYVLNEAMDPGSSTPLSGYSQSISYTNLTPGGTAVPTSTTIPGNVNLALADMVVATIVNTLIPPTITSTKQAINFTDLNSVVTYTLTFKNNGAVSVNSVKLLDTIPPGTTFQSGSLTVNGASLAGNPEPPSGVIIGTIPAGDTYTVTFNVLVGNTLPNPNPFINNANASFTYSQVPSDGSGSTNTNSVSTKVNGVILNSSKIVNKNYANVGDVLTYTIPITSSGNVTATNITFIDTIPNGTVLVPLSFIQDGVQISGSPNPPGVTLSNIVAGKTSTIVFKVTIISIPSPNPIPNTASVSYSYLVEPTASTKIAASNTNTVNTQVNNASLSGISKYVDKTFATCGDTINYLIVIPNTGNITAINVIVKDTIPNGTVLVPTSVFVNNVSAPGANPNIGVTIPNIAPGATATLTFSVQVQC